MCITLHYYTSAMRSAEDSVCVAKQFAPTAFGQSKHQESEFFDAVRRMTKRNLSHHGGYLPCGPCRGLLFQQHSADGLSRAWALHLKVPSCWDV